VLKRAAFKRAGNVSNVTSSHRSAAGKLFHTAGPETKRDQKKQATRVTQYINAAACCKLMVTIYLQVPFRLLKITRAKQREKQRHKKKTTYRN